MKNGFHLLLINFNATFRKMSKACNYFEMLEKKKCGKNGGKM